MLSFVKVDVMEKPRTVLAIIMPCNAILQAAYTICYRVYIEMLLSLLSSMVVVLAFIIDCYKAAGNHIL